MKKKLIYIELLLFVILFGCGKNKEMSDVKAEFETTYSKQKTLSILKESKEIKLLQQDDAYGEWGGDVDVIRVYLHKRNTYADYNRYEGRNAILPPPHEMDREWFEYKTHTIKMDSLKLNEKEKTLVEIAITNLLKNKLRNNNIPVYGIFNSVVSIDSSLVLNDLHSFEWKSFIELKESLKHKRIIG